MATRLIRKIKVLLVRNLTPTIPRQYAICTVKNYTSLSAQDEFLLSVNLVIVQNSPLNW